MLFTVKTIGGRSRGSFQPQQAALGAVNGYVEELIGGQKGIKVLNHEQKTIDQFYTLNASYRPAATAPQAGVAQLTGSWAWRKKELMDTAPFRFVHHVT